MITGLLSDPYCKGREQYLVNVYLLFISLSIHLRHRYHFLIGFLDATSRSRWGFRKQVTAVIREKNLQISVWTSREYKQDYSRYLFCFPVSSVAKNPSASAGDTGLIPESGKIPCRWKQQLYPVFLPGKSHGQRSLAGCSPLGHKRVGYNFGIKQQSISLTQLLSHSEGKRTKCMPWMVNSQSVIL